MDPTISIVGSSYFEPIAVLLERMEKSGAKYVEGQRPTVTENGYAASICLLAVACLESYVARSRHQNSKGTDSDSVFKYLSNTFNDYPFWNETREIFSCRDALVHNHLVEEFTERDEDGISTGVVRNNRISQGDKKFREIVDLDAEHTQNLKLNTIPTNVGAADAVKVLTVVARNLLFIESKDRNHCYTSHLSVRYGNKRLLFHDLIENIRQMYCPAFELTEINLEPLSIF